MSKLQLNPQMKQNLIDYLSVSGWTQMTPRQTPALLRFKKQNRILVLSHERVCVYTRVNNLLELTSSFMYTRELNEVEWVFLFCMLRIVPLRGVVHELISIQDSPKQLANA